MEPKIGGEYEYDGNILEVREVKDEDGCDLCYFQNMEWPPCIVQCDTSMFAKCTPAKREDGKFVNFVKVDTIEDWDLTIDDDYYELESTLDDAYAQAASGKGKERHANDNPYEDQVICQVQRLLKDHPFGGHAYQVIKKTIEAGRLYNLGRKDEAYEEILGAINYNCATGILMREEE
jgi:hypothetical protein